MIAVALEETLIEAGFRVAGVIGKVEKAVASVVSGGCDVAIVDFNLAGVSAGPVAEALTACNVPFIVTSGYSQEQMQGQFAGVPFLAKPCRPDVLIETLESVLPRR